MLKLDRRGGGRPLYKVEIMSEGHQGYSPLPEDPRIPWSPPLWASPWHSLARTAKERYSEQQCLARGVAGTFRSTTHIVHITRMQEGPASIRTGSLTGYKPFSLHTQKSASLSPCCVNRAHRGSTTCCHEVCGRPRARKNKSAHENNPPCSVAGQRFRAGWSPGRHT